MWIHRKCNSFNFPEHLIRCSILNIFLIVELYQPNQFLPELLYRSLFSLERIVLTIHWYFHWFHAPKKSGGQNKICPSSFAIVWYCETLCHYLKLMNEQACLNVIAQ